MSRKEHHVVPNRDGWSVKRAGTARASVNTNTKAEAVRIGHVISQRQGSNLRIHGKDGRIQSAKKTRPSSSKRKK